MPAAKPAWPTLSQQAKSNISKIFAGALKKQTDLLDKYALLPTLPRIPAHWGR